MNLADYCRTKTGKGVWKWEHYLPVYERHFARFVGQEVRVLEIGVMGGGSLEMWRTYFGPWTTVCGVDKNPACRKHDDGDRTRVFVGDQGDRAFWAEFRRQLCVERGAQLLDIVIDDGSHEFEDQVVTFEEMWPYLAPGGVYLCEDCHGCPHWFVRHVCQWAEKLHETHQIEAPELTAAPTAFQQEVASVHQYPFVVVIEKRAGLLELTAPKRGDMWD